ncbi:MAG: calcineurin-like phosphoesterase C-terminal domain-containing protein [Candidatus Cyclobacteriaceae bacterium M3_2C_046]
MRINILIKLILLVFSLINCPAEAKTDHLVEGFVYNDFNRNCRKDAGEAGIAGVLVSNGKEIVATDSCGKYLICLGQDSLLFVIKPGSLAYARNADNLPNHYLYVKPGLLNNFPLYEDGTVDSFSVCLMGDPQVTDQTELGYLAQVIQQELVGRDYQLGICLGDVTSDQPDLMKSVNQIISSQGQPWFFVLGNHDLDLAAKTDHQSRDRFEKIYGPSTYAFNQGKVHFLVLNNVVYPHGPGKSFTIGLSPDQFEFIRNDLKWVIKDQLVVLLMHLPLTALSQDQRQKLMTLLEPFPHQFSVSAHLHNQQKHFFRLKNGIIHPHFICGTISGDHWQKLPDEKFPVSLMNDGTPPGYWQFHFKGHQYSYDYHPWLAHLKDKMHVMIDKPYRAFDNFRLKVVVNFYEGSDSTKIQYRVGNNDWKNMKKVNLNDLLYTRRFKSLMENTPKSGFLRAPSFPMASRHIWIGDFRFPLADSVKTHQVAVKVLDDLGRVYEKTISYRLAH